MIFLEAGELAPGMELARDVANPSLPHMTLLCKGHVLKGKTIRALARFPIRGLWVRDEDLVYLETLLPQEVDQAIRELVIQGFALWTSLERQPDGYLPARPFEAMVEDCLSLLKKIDLAYFSWRPAYTGEVFYGVHGAYSMVLALVMAKGLQDYLEEQFPSEAPVRKISTLLGLASLLHDIGNLKVPRHLLYEAGELSPSQMEDVRRHTEYGYKMLHSEFGPHVALAAMHHHQRFDGKGYPGRTYSKKETPRSLAGHRIPVLARLVSIADVFITMVSDRPYAAGRKWKEAWEEIRSLSRQAFDPVLVQCFVETVPPYPPGSRLTLADGSRAVVTGVNEKSPLSPPLRTVQEPDGSWLPLTRREDIAPGFTTDIGIAEEPESF